MGDVGAFLDQCGLSRDTAWLIDSVIVIDGWAGTPSIYEKKTPIVPIKSFVEVLRLTNDLRVLHKHLAEGTWLPMEGVDFTTTAFDRKWLGIRFLGRELTTKSASFWSAALPNRIAGRADTQSKSSAQE